MMCFLWQHEMYLWYLPGTACLYSGPSPVDLACLRNHLLHACRYRYCGCHPQDTAVGKDITHYSFLSIRAVVYGIFHAYSHDTYILVVRCMKQNKDTVWSLVLLLVPGVLADPKYSYSCYIICMYVRIVNVCSSLKYFFYYFSRYLVVGSRYHFFFRFNNMRRNTCRSNFVQYQAKTWKQPCAAFRGQGDAAVRQIASMNDSYGYTILNCVWPHHSNIPQLAYYYYYDYCCYYYCYYY